MQHTYFHYLSPKDCKYKLNGQNLFELRRAVLRMTIAKPLGLDMDGTKNDLLGRIIRALDGLEAPIEIAELASMGVTDESETDDTKRTTETIRETTSEAD